MSIQNIDIQRIRRLQDNDFTLSETKKEVLNLIESLRACSESVIISEISFKSY